MRTVSVTRNLLWTAARPTSPGQRGGALRAMAGAPPPAARGVAPAGRCGPDTPLLSAAELQRGLASLPSWRAVAGGQAPSSIERAFTARNFAAAMAFLNAAAGVAEAAGHHPDFHLERYREVRVVLSTHAAGGVTALDLALAAQLDALPVDYSKKWAEAQQQAAPQGGAAGGGGDAVG